MSKPIQEITSNYALYNGDCMEVVKKLKKNSIHITCYSPPFGGLYQYSSDPRDMSNCMTPEQFFEHYRFLVKEIHRVTLPGRMSCVHACDIPRKSGGLRDLPGDIIRLHEETGWEYHARFAIWKEPLRVAIRTRSKGLMHKQIVKDATFCNNAGADYLLVFRKKGESKVPVPHASGLLNYAGEREVPAGFELPNGKVVSTEEYRNNWKDPQTNKLAHWIWQQYASAFWDDIRLTRILPYREARESEEEKHCHPLQLDVIERCVIMWSNPGEIVLTPFMGVGSEVYGAVINGRRGIGVELKPSYFRQACENLREAGKTTVEQPELLGDMVSWPQEDDVEEVEAT